MLRASGRLAAAIAIASVALTAPIASAATHHKAKHHKPKAKSTTAPKSTTPAPATPVHLAELTLTVASTSEWTNVKIAPGTILSQKVISTSGPATWTEAAYGLSMTGGTKNVVSRITEQVIFSDPAVSSSYALAVTKGFDGAAQVSFNNLDASAPTAVTSYQDAVQNKSGDGTNPATFNVDRSVWMTSTPLQLPSADKRHLVIADYYPWYPDYSDPTLADTPQNPRTTNTLAGVESMTEQAKANGVNGFAVVYDGSGSDGHDAQFKLAVQAAQDNNQLVTPYIATPRAASTNSPAVTEQQWIEGSLAEANSSAFLTAANGQPVIYVYEMYLLSADQWSNILANVKSDTGYSVQIIGDDPASAYLPYEYGVDTYPATASASSVASTAMQLGVATKGPSVFDSTVAPKLYVGTVSPGFNDTKLKRDNDPVVPRDGGQRYIDTWNGALQGQPDWILVTSWNEWYEDSQIEPGVNTGSQALSQTASLSQEWKAGASTF